MAIIDWFATADPNVFRNSHAQVGWHKMNNKSNKYFSIQSRPAIGFTLIELLITVAIVGIITAIAYPAYTQYLLRAGRGEATSTLLEAMERQEQVYRNNLTYTANLADLGYPDPLKSETDRYRITAGTCDSLAIRRCVKLTATAQPKQEADGPTITLTSRGEKTGNWPGQ